MFEANSGFVDPDSRRAVKSAHRRGRRVSVALRVWALSASVAAFASFGCGTPHAIFVITAPSSATAGSPFTITVTTMEGANRDTVINSSIRFSSSDRAALLPPDYYFKANDLGSHTFTNGVTLRTVGSQTITVIDIGAPGLNGTATVTVSASTAQQKVTELSKSFRQPTL